MAQVVQYSLINSFYKICLIGICIGMEGSESVMRLRGYKVKGLESYKVGKLGAWIYSPPRHSDEGGISQISTQD
jgi:hypothetical protein